MNVKILLLVVIVLGARLVVHGQEVLEPPKLTNSPRLDVIVTNRRPLLSVFNAKGGSGSRTYIFQLDTSAQFDSPDLRSYSISETPQVTSMRIPVGDELADQSRYFWRVKAVDSKGIESRWGTEAGEIIARFWVDTTSDDHAEGLVRTQIMQITDSGGTGKSNLLDQGDQADRTFWSGQAGLREHWLEFDLGEARSIYRLWILASPDELSGRPQEYSWEHSSDRINWQAIDNATYSDSDSFRVITELTQPVRDRFFRLRITHWHGATPRVAEIALYSDAKPVIPQIPEKPYVLIIGNRHDGTGYENIVSLIAKMSGASDTLTIPYYLITPEVIDGLSHPPRAIVLSGLGRNYETLPMFEFNGEFELIRTATRPILGICGGHQLLAMSEGYTFVRQMGRGVYAETIEDILAQGVKPIKITQKDLLLEGLPNPFFAVQLHHWEIAVVPTDYEVLASSECVEIVKHIKKPIYGEQFHGEIDTPFNVGRLFTVNFLQAVSSNDGL